MNNRRTATGTAGDPARPGPARPRRGCCSPASQSARVTQVPELPSWAPSTDAESRRARRPGPRSLVREPGARIPVTDRRTRCRSGAKKKGDDPGRPALAPAESRDGPADRRATRPTPAGKGPVRRPSPASSGGGRQRTPPPPFRPACPAASQRGGPLPRVGRWARWSRAPAEVARSCGGGAALMPRYQPWLLDVGPAESCGACAPGSRHGPRVGPCPLQSAKKCSLECFASELR